MSSISAKFLKKCQCSYIISAFQPRDKPVLYTLNDLHIQVDEHIERRQKKRQRKKERLNKNTNA